VYRLHRDATCIPVLRNSIIIIVTSSVPRSRKHSRSASTRVAEAAGVTKPRYPRRAILACCCARATSGHANNAVPENWSNSRRLMIPPPVPAPKYGSRSHLTNSTLTGRPATGELPMGLRPSPPKDRRDTTSPPVAPPRRAAPRGGRPPRCRRTLAGPSLDQLIRPLKEQRRD